MKAKKSVLCLSWCDADEVINYGQVLQGMAMMTVMRQLNDGQIIYISYRHRRLREKVDYLVYHYNPFSGHLFSYHKTRRMLKKVISDNQIDFRQVNDRRKLELYEISADVMICGSDQIWHPQNYDKNYYLNFGLENAKRVSYAASLPKISIEPIYKEIFEKISNAIKAIDVISVREEGSCKLVKALSHKQVISVLDPTCLVSSSIWADKIEYINTPQNFVFVYIPNGMDEKMVQIVNAIRNQYGIDDVLVMMTRGENYFKNIKNLKFVSVGQFLYLIKHADIIVTTSFHAVVFSTLFHTDFFAYDVCNECRGEDIRLSDFLTKLNLEDRCISNDLVFDDIKKINFSFVEERLNDMRKTSIDFLEAVLK